MSLEGRLLDRPEAPPPEPDNDWLGRPGTRIDFRFVCVGYMETHTAFGKAVLYRLRTDAGNVVEWFAHGRLAAKRRLLRPGRIYFGRATIKGTRTEGRLRVTEVSRLALQEGAQINLG